MIRTPNFACRNAGRRRQPAGWLNMNRIIEPEWLDELPVDDAGAAGSRRDLQRLNRIMNHGGILRDLLKSGTRDRPPRRIVELGAGDGTLMLQLAKYFSCSWPRVEVVLVDWRNAVTEDTQAGFAALGWPVETVTADIFDWLQKPAEVADVMITNLFLHHFSEDELVGIMRLAAARTRLFAACEPRRALLPLMLSRMVGFIGCNAVTRHDAVLSVRAGFAGRELSALWPAPTQWRLQEQSAGWFTHAFTAKRTAAA